MLIVPEPGETPLEALLRIQGESESIFYWTEDNLHPYTEYDRLQDKAKWELIELKRRLAPPVP